MSSCQLKNIGEQRKKDRIIFYDKSIELRKDKSLKNSGYCNKVLTDFFGVNRFEQNITSLKDIRHYYQNTGITEVLNSTTKANYLKFTAQILLISACKNEKQLRKI